MRSGVVAALFTIAHVGGAQAVRSATLKPATATLAMEFTNILSARELRDGRVLVADAEDKGLVVVNFRTGAVEPVGRKGDGPLEYPAVLELHALGGDSTLMAVTFGRRWLVLDGARIVSTLAPDGPVLSAAGSGAVVGYDGRGGIILSRAPAVSARVAGNPLPDSLKVLRVDLASGAATDLAMIRAVKAVAHSAPSAPSPPSPPSAAPRPGEPPRGFVVIRPQAYFTREFAVPARDGWLAMIRLDPYRVDWRAPNGTVAHGTPLPFTEDRVTDREKLARMLFIARTDAPKSPDTAGDWPETIPPFESRGQPAMISPDGKVLVRRVQTADHPEMRYDVVNRRGDLERQLTLLKGERIVGFGAASLYVTAADDDGIQRLRRHPWP